VPLNVSQSCISFIRGLLKEVLQRRSFLVVQVSHQLLERTATFGHCSKFARAKIAGAAKTKVRLSPWFNTLTAQQRFKTPPGCRFGDAAWLTSLDNGGEY
jgi:hypothetical protein